MLDVCRLLSHWVVHTPLKAPASQLAFRPRSTSLMPIDGHWASKGDLVARPDLHFPLCVECKKHEDGYLDGLFDAPKWSVWGWWDQAKAQAAATNLTPALIFCRNLRENRIALPTSAARCLAPQPRHGPIIDVTRPDGETLTICLLADVLALPPSKLHRLFLDEAPRSPSSGEAKSRSGSSKSTTLRSRRRTRSG